MRALILTILIFSQLSLTAQTFPDKIGIGLGGIGGFGMEFIDASKTMRSFDGASVDALGYPQGNFQIVVFDMRPCCPWIGSVDDPQAFVPDLMAGKYKLSFQGQATITSVGDPVTIQSNVYDETTNTSTADIIVQKGNWLVILNFTNTKRTAVSAANTGITDIKLLRPGYHNRPDDVFRQEYINAVSHFPAIRFMDFTGTNNSNPDFPGITGWNTRHIPGQALFNGIAPWEYVVELANLTGKDVWITVPVAASDDYVQQLANLLKDNLHEDAVVYFEYSNEVWNGLFDQYHYNIAAARAEVEEETGGGASTTLNDEAGQCDPQDENLWGGRRYVKRMKEIGDIFIETFSPGNRSSFETKIRPVFAWQIGGWVPYYSCILTWFEQIYGNADEYFYGLAGAAYVNDEDAAPNALPQAILDRMTANSDAFRGEKRETPTTWWTGEGKIGLKEIADIFNLRMLQYETGPDNGGGSNVNVANRIRANRDGGMKNVLLRDLKDNWFADPQIGGDLVMYFVLASSYTRYGSWGATEEVENMHTPKLKALYEIAGIEEDIEPPAFPENISVTMQGEDAVVTWEAASDNRGVTHYRVYDQHGAAATVLASEPYAVTLSKFNPTDISKVKVTAFDAFNNESGDVITSVERSVGSMFTLYPNPVKDVLMVEPATEGHPYGISVSDVFGTELLHLTGGSSQNIPVDMRRLPSGMYVIKIQSGGYSSTHRIIKQ